MAITRWRLSGVHSQLVMYSVLNCTTRLRSWLSQMWTSPLRLPKPYASPPTASPTPSSSRRLCGDQRIVFTFSLPQLPSSLHSFAEKLRIKPGEDNAQLRGRRDGGRHRAQERAVVGEARLLHRLLLRVRPGDSSHAAHDGEDHVSALLGVVEHVEELRAAVVGHARLRLTPPRSAHAVDVAADGDYRPVALLVPLAERLVAVQHALLATQREVRALLLRAVREERHHALALLQGREHDELRVRRRRRGYSGVLGGRRQGHQRGGGDHEGRGAAAVVANHFLAVGVVQVRAVEDRDLRVSAARSANRLAAVEERVLLLRVPLEVGPALAMRPTGKSDAASK